MIFLRVLALLASALVLILPPLLLGNAGLGGLPLWIAIVSLLVTAVISASFVYVGLAGGRIRRNRSERTLGGAMLAVPIATGILLLASCKEAMQLWSSGLLLALSLLLFLSFVFPTFDGGRRPMRRRERQEPMLLKLPVRSPQT